MIEPEQLEGYIAQHLMRRAGPYARDIIAAFKVVETMSRTQGATMKITTEPGKGTKAEVWINDMRTVVAWDEDPSYAIAKAVSIWLGMEGVL